MKGNMDALTITKYVYKSAIISGTTMICNDVMQYVAYIGGKSTPFGKALRNLSSLACGYCAGKHVADKSWDYIETAIERYQEG